MRVKVWTDAEEMVTRCKLIDDVTDAGVQVVAVDSHGAELGTIVALSAHGIRRCRGVDPSLGFPLDDLGRVLLVGEEPTPRVVKRSEIEEMIGLLVFLEFTPVGKGTESLARAALIKGIEFAGGRVED